MIEVSDYKLTDLLSSAGATIGVIIGGTIFLQFVSSKYVELAGRYRDMTDEYRGRKSEEARHKPLRGQIQIYHRRLSLLNRASTAGGAALLGLILSVLCGGFSLAFPPVVAFKVAGSVTLFLGLVLIAVAVVLEVIEVILSRAEIHQEVADLDEEAQQAGA